VSGSEALRAFGELGQVRSALELCRAQRCLTCAGAFRSNATEDLTAARQARSIDPSHNDLRLSGKAYCACYDWLYNASCTATDNKQSGVCVNPP
jgi:hypothetical protein